MRIFGQLGVLMLLACGAPGWAQELWLAGTVRLDDGEPPDGAIRVELICGAERAAETECDTGGGFTLPSPPRKGCLVRASLAGYLSHTIPVDRVPENPEISALVLRRDGKWKGAAISSTWLGAPDGARAAYDRAIREMRRGADGELEVVESSLLSAVDQYPGYAAAWYELGVLRLATGKPGAAREALGSAIQADPWFIAPYEPMLILSLAQERWTEARKLCDRLLVMNPYLTNARYYRGIASLQLGEIDEGRKELRAIEDGLEGETFAPVHHLSGLLHEKKGEFQQAAAEYWNAVQADPESELAGKLKRLLGEWMAEGRIEQPW
jgi:tetratricopeptide (TPR) repeat protein